MSETAKALPVGATMFGGLRPLAAHYPFVVVSAVIVLLFLLAAILRAVARGPPTRWRSVRCSGCGRRAR